MKGCVFMDFITQEQIETINKLTNNGYEDELTAFAADMYWRGAEEGAARYIKAFNKGVHKSMVTVAVGSVILGLTCALAEKIIDHHFEKKKEESES